MNKARVLLLLIVAAVLLSVLLATGILEKRDVKPKPVLRNTDIYKAIANPKGYQGARVVLTGQIAQDPEYDREGTHFLLSVLAPDQDSLQVIVDYPATRELTSGDFTEIKGDIIGPFSGLTDDGHRIKTARIKAREIQPVSSEIAIPPRAVWRPGEKQTDHQVEITIDKVEFAADETRLYMTIKNQGPSSIVNQVFNSELSQAGKSHSPVVSNKIKHKEVSIDISAGESSSGTLVFPKLDPNQPMDFSFRVSGDGWETEFKFKLTPPV